MMKILSDWVVAFAKDWWKLLLGIAISSIVFNRCHSEGIKKYEAKVAVIETDLLIEKEKNVQQKKLNDILIKANLDKAERDAKIIEVKEIEVIEVKKEIQKKIIKDLEKSPSDLAKDFANEFGATYVKNNEN